MSLVDRFDFPRSGKRAPTVGLVPLIDVAMFLLIFFMVAGTIEKFEIIPVNPPHAESGALVDEGHLVILLGSHDEVVVGEELTDVPGMKPLVAAAVKENPDKVITVKADASIPAVRMIAVMDQIKEAGGRNLSVVTQSMGEKAP